MIKIVSNIKKRLAVFLLSALLIGQGSGYLAQKLMVENNIRGRIKDALSKIIDNNKYVINVDIDLEISDEIKEQITVLSEKNPNQSSADMPEETEATALDDASSKQNELPENVLMGIDEIAITKGPIIIVYKNSKFLAK